MSPFIIKNKIEKTFENKTLYYPERIASNRSFEGFVHDYYQEKPSQDVFD